MICSNCGRQSEPGDKFCQKCGTPLVADKSLKESFLNWFKKHKNFLCLSGGVILLLIIIITILEVGLMKGGEFFENYNS